MSASPQAEVAANIEADWRSALIRAERARQDYAQYMKTPDRDESELQRMWLHLWFAERRREELFRRMD
jgi:hypothetical protein